MWWFDRFDFMVFDCGGILIWVDCCSMLLFDVGYGLDLEIYLGVCTKTTGKCAVGNWSIDDVDLLVSAIYWEKYKTVSIQFKQVNCSLDRFVIGSIDELLIWIDCCSSVVLFELFDVWFENQFRSLPDNNLQSVPSQIGQLMSLTSL